ncbi:hypothetical protein EV421DRAFT_163774 [Armillaria borealis]|uniref:Uncharacterized protein n=1 Tax=Armillaria borealis TaxID=47425 RepID=A0AA39MF84_9AGAR|nr:hypothetical protein EV421DRAFT_163774 [Armillaria borealis]
MDFGIDPPPCGEPSVNTSAQSSSVHEPAIPLFTHHRPYGHHTLTHCRSHLLTFLIFAQERHSSTEDTYTHSPPLVLMLFDILLRKFLSLHPRQFNLNCAQMKRLGWKEMQQTERQEGRVPPCVGLGGLIALRVVGVPRVAAISSSKKIPRLPFSPPYLGPIYPSRTSGFPSWMSSTVPTT